jgi:hypothetical protein
MGYDQDRYNSLISRASFDCSFYKGTIQDQSKSRLAMGFVGAPSWGRINGLPCLQKPGTTGNGITTAVIPAILDVTGTVTFETLCFKEAFHVRCLRQADLGGFELGNKFGGGGGELTLFDAAGAAARLIRSPNFVVNTPIHLIVTSVAGGTAGRTWVNGVPGTTSLVFAGVAANAPPSAVLVLGGGYGGGLSISRAWQGALTNEDCAALYGAAHAMFPEV